MYFKTHTSPGLVALGPGKFSASGVATIRLIGSWSCAAAQAVATTAAAPPILGDQWELNPGRVQQDITYPCPHASTSSPGGNELMSSLPDERRDMLNSSGLETDPTAIEGDSFADKGQGLSILSCSLVVAALRYQSHIDNAIRTISHLEELGRLCSSMSNGEEGSLQRLRRGTDKGSGGTNHALLFGPS